MKNIICLSAIFFLVAVIATTASFGFDDDDARQFGNSDLFNRKYQAWVGKRGLGQPSTWGFGRPIGDHYRYFNWKDYFANIISKRQLGFGPRSFGNYRRYFTNGLQDWKSTFRGLRK